MKYISGFICLFILANCKKTEAPPQVCYTCTTELTEITSSPATPSVKITTTNQDVCGDISRDAVLSLQNRHYSGSGFSTYYVTKCAAKP